MDLEEIFYLLALQKVSGVGDIKAKKLLRYFGSAKSVYENIQHTSSKIPEIGKFVIEQIQKFDAFDRVEKEMAYVEKNNIKIITIFDDEYPQKLFHAPDGPILFFSKGNFRLNGRKLISIVGTRNMTAYGKRTVQKIIEELAVFNPIIISGLAYGVDVEAHLSAMENNLETIGVLGHGFQRIYPAVHKNVAEKMIHNGGLITEFWHTDTIDRNNFLKRNRIVAGLSEALIVIESGKKGGALVTADIANSYNRDVLAVPGRISDRFSEGCNDLIKNNKAQMITSGLDVIKFLNWDIQPKPKKEVQLNLFVDLNPEEQQIFDFLQKNGKTLLDDLVVELNIPVSKATNTLLQMELKNIVVGLPGKYFEII